MSVIIPVFVYLGAAVLAVPLAVRLGLGSVLGYLLAGVAIGPHALGLVASANESVSHVAEFGIVMMLFLIGLELKPDLLWRSRRQVLGMGAFQLLGTAGVVMAISVLAGQSWKASLAIGFIIAMSSTAIALQSLREKGLLKTQGGEASFAILLFQDIAVIPIISIMPLLATMKKAGETHHEGAAPFAALAAWERALLVIAAVGLLIFAGRYLLRPFLRAIARTDLREMFTAATLLLVVGIVLLMQQVGLSPALGAFLAGVLLADSEFRVQLETDIEPFKGILLGLFFFTVGAAIDFPLIAKHLATVSLLVASVLIVKFAVLFGLAKFFGLERGQAFLLSLALAQGGEFAFLLLTFSAQQGVLAPEMSSLLTATVALTMAASPLLLLLNDRLVQPRFQEKRAAREPDVIDERDNPVILAGFGRFGTTVGRLLRANGVGTTVLDYDPEQVEYLRRFGMKSFYGDASRLDLLRAAGAERAKLFILAIDDEAKAREIAQMVQKNFPNLKILARAVSRQHAYELLNLGITEVFRETQGSAIDLGIQALRDAGFDETRAQRAARLFRDHDEAAVRDMAQLDAKSETYASRARLHQQNLLQALQADDAEMSRSP